MTFFVVAWGLCLFQQAPELSLAVLQPTSRDRQLQESPDHLERSQRSFVFVNQTYLFL